jgi:3-isopropylmalate/(R)-2-methylmalate dehydratase small subunit
VIIEPFTTLTAVAVPLDEPNLDTNQLAPTRYSQVPRGPVYARVLLHEQRFDPDGAEKDYILNREPYRCARIVVAARNFGCGSSRETAVYALCEFGIRCVIAPSFGDIFAGNCFKNGLLPVVLGEDETAAIRQALHESANKTMTVDLESEVVTDSAGRRYAFRTNAVRRKCLLEGLDDIARTQQYGGEIEAFERAYRTSDRWVFDRGR